MINEKQDELMLELTVSKPGSYVLLIEYVTPFDNRDSSGGMISIDVRSDTSQDHSKVFLNSCPYTAICRHVLLDENKRVQVFKIPDNFIGLTVKVFKFVIDRRGVDGRYLEKITLKNS